MNKFIITEEERSRILNMHVERTKNQYLTEDFEDVYTDSREDYQYDIEAVDCEEGFDGHVDIDEDDTIVIRYCEGNDEDLEYLKEKGQRLLNNKYGY